jgi:uncharacterized protein involved in exopolysaccharide biosynthesis
MNESGLAKLRGVIRRRRIPVFVMIVGVVGVAAATISRVEPGYKAQAVLRLTEVQPAKEYVAPTVAEQLGERLKSLRLSVMARPLVADAAQSLDVFRAWPRRPHDEVIDSIRSRMDVRLEGEDTFLLTYIDSNPERARAIVNKVAELFSQRYVERREQIASATANALRAEVDALRPKLEESERAIREYRVKHYGALPDQQEGNLRLLDQTTMELNIQSTNLDLDLDRRRQILAAAMSPLRHHEETLAAQLYDARTQYTEDNPLVEKTRAEYERVKAERIADEKDLDRKARVRNPELAALDGEIARSKAFIDGLRDRQAEVRRRVDATAGNGAALAELTAVHDALRDKHALALARLRDAELAEQLERGLASLRVDLVEGASLPMHAVAPNRPLLGAAALLAALLMGLGLGFALDAHDTSIRDAGQLRAVTPSIPILACIPHTTFNRVKAEA